MNSSYNITLLGDSISKGVIYDEKKERYVITKDNFSNIVGLNLTAAINNAGKFGSTILKGSKKLYDELTKGKPDIVVIEFGGNDCDFNWEEVAQNPLTEHLPNTDLTVFEDTLKKIIKSLKEKNITPILMTLPPLDAEKYFQWISKKSEAYKKNILTWLGSVNTIYSWHENYSSKIADIAKEMQTNLIDIRSAFLAQKDYKSYLCVDGIHPNQVGHKLIADKILEYIKINYNFLLKDFNI